MFVLRLHFERVGFDLNENLRHGDIIRRRFSLYYNEERAIAKVNIFALKK